MLPPVIHHLAIEGWATPSMSCILRTSSKIVLCLCQVASLRGDLEKARDAAQALAAREAALAAELQSMQVVPAFMALHLTKERDTACISELRKVTTK